MNRGAISSKARVARHRVALRARGLRPVQFWIADTRATGFWDEARRQARAVAALSTNDLAFAEAAQYWPDDL